MWDMLPSRPVSKPHLSETEAWGLLLVMQRTTPVVLRGVDKEPHRSRILAEAEKSPRWETFAMWALFLDGGLWEDLGGQLCSP